MNFKNIVTYLLEDNSVIETIVFKFSYQWKYNNNKKKQH